MGFDPAAVLTNLLYVGEEYDPVIGQYYLDARYYDPLTGRLNQLDSFAGNSQEPLSLHKYNYTACNPINQIDPSGMDWFFANLGKAVHREIENMYRNEHPGAAEVGKSIPGLAGALLPDIMDFSLKEIAEIKPLSGYGLVTGPIQLGTYLTVSNKLGISGAVNKPWTPMTLPHLLYHYELEYPALIDTASTGMPVENFSFSSLKNSSGVRFPSELCGLS